MNINFGYHISKEKSFLKTYENIDEFGLKTSQIYVSNGRSYNPPKPVLVDLLQTRKYLERKNHTPYIHGKLLYNLAGCADGKKKDPSKYNSNLHLTKEGLLAELDIGSVMGGAVVVHIGSNKDKEEGIDTIVDTLYKVLTSDSIFAKDFVSSKIDLKSGRKLLLENSAGEGNKLGSTLTDIAIILTKFDEKCIFEKKPELKNNLGVCLDTAHIHGQGDYDLSIGKAEFSEGKKDLSNKKSVVKFFEDLEEKDILDRLELIHFNDSKVELGSKKDRHAVIGEGKIWGSEKNKSASLEALREFLNIVNDYKINLIGEPNDSAEKNSDIKSEIDLIFPGYSLIQSIVEDLNKNNTFRC